jgi:hypothetical protein
MERVGIIESCRPCTSSVGTFRVELRVRYEAQLDSQWVAATMSDPPSESREISFSTSQRTFESETLLPARQQLRAEVKVRWVRKLEGTWVPIQGTTETRQATFTTADYDPRFRVVDVHHGTHGSWPDDANDC